MDDFENLGDELQNLGDELMRMRVYRVVMDWAQNYSPGPQDMIVVAVRIPAEDRTPSVQLANYLRSKGFYCKQIGCHSEPDKEGGREYVYSIGVKKTKF